MLPSEDRGLLSEREILQDQVGPAGRGHRRRAGRQPEALQDRAGRVRRMDRRERSSSNTALRWSSRATAEARTSARTRCRYSSASASCTSALRPPHRASRARSKPGPARSRPAPTTSPPATTGPATGPATTSKARAAWPTKPIDPGVRSRQRPMRRGAHGPRSRPRNADASSSPSRPVSPTNGNATACSPASSQHPANNGRSRASPSPARSWISTIFTSGGGDLLDRFRAGNGPESLGVTGDLGERRPATGSRAARMGLAAARRRTALELRVSQHPIADLAAAVAAGRAVRECAAC